MEGVCCIFTLLSACTCIVYFQTGDALTFTRTTKNRP